MSFKKVVLSTFALAALAVSPAHAQPAEFNGTILKIWNEATSGSEFIFTLSVNGRCGTPHFQVSRSSTNYQEMMAIVLAAFTANKPVGIYVASCRNYQGISRNIVSHGYVSK